MHTQRNAIHVTAFIGDGVVIGDGVAIGPFAVLLGPTTIGSGAWVGAGAKIGAPPEIASLRQNVAWAGDVMHSGVEIGANVVIRENVVAHQVMHRQHISETAIGALEAVYASPDLALQSLESHPEWQAHLDIPRWWEKRTDALSPLVTPDMAAAS